VQKQKQSAAKLGSRPNFRTDNAGFPNPVPPRRAIRGPTIKNKNLPYISITYGGESVSQLPLKDKAFLTFPDQNPPFELPPKAGVSPPIFHGIHRGSSKFQLITSKVQMEMSRFEHDSHAGRNRTAFNSSTDVRAWEDSPRRYSQRYSRDFRSHGGRGSIPKACTRQSVFEHIP
jgi:hypothetical protein